MDVILLQDLDNLGAEGDIVSVKPGYGRNYLIPKGLALMATKGAVKARQEEMRQQVRKRAQAEANAEELKKQLEGTEIVVEARVGEENRIFGTVTSQQVALKLATQGFEIDRRQVELSEDIRIIGVYTAHVKLHRNVVADVKVRVVPEGDPETPAAEATPDAAEATPDAPADAETPAGEATPEAPAADAETPAAEAAPEASAEAAPDAPEEAETEQA